MADMTYIKLFVDYLDAIEPLGDAERGRLFTSLLEYARTGEAPQLGGNERFLFPMMRAQIDRDNAAMTGLSEARSKAGKIGAEAKQANAGFAKQNKQMPNLPSKSSYDKDKDKDKDKDESIMRTRRFTPPTLDDVLAYVRERGSDVDPQRFLDFYASKGWMVGKNPMKDWKAAVRTWEKREDTGNHSNPTPGNNAWMKEYL
nr:MAG TPA: hypothetical protein [Caudoviricetes sp.]